MSTTYRCDLCGDEIDCEEEHHIVWVCKHSMQDKPGDHQTRYDLCSRCPKKFGSKEKKRDLMGELRKRRAVIVMPMKESWDEVYELLGGPYLEDSSEQGMLSMTCYGIPITWGEYKPC